MATAKKLSWVLRLNGVTLRLRDLSRRLFPFLLDPLKIRAVALETTTACTRNCPYCPPHSNMAIPPLKMSREIFTRAVSSLGARGYAGDIFFSLYGESLADDRLGSLLAEAKAAAPAARLVVFTNGDLLTVERFLSLRAAGLDVMFISLHSPEPGEALAGTLEKIKRDCPGPDCVGLVDYYSQYLPGNDVGLLNNKGGLADVHRRPFLSCCDIESACVDCLGNVLLCNNDCTSSYVFGNVLEKDFYEIWEAPAFVLARRKITRGKWIFEICRRCMSRGGLTTPVPRGKAARLPPAFNDMAATLKKLEEEAAAKKKGGRRA
ncbi:MAG TPA: hypothetical protein DEQ38_12280 [Elusimicrobia bacterium]|nr:MAG: hypothetical protein A2089_05700 [Elusimicrobia bacterium GWD2_63_28]HCC48876.1 hypothetical protein [Elusimicrobiota bacterium]